MIQVSAMPNISYTARIASQYNGYGSSTANERIARAESVTISNAGRAINEAISQAINQGAEVKPLKPGELPKLPDWSFSYEKASQRAEIGLKEAMRQLGIPPGTHVSMTLNNDGTISVASGSTQNAELEAIVNNNMDLRNSIVAAQNAAYFSRIVDAASQAQSAMNANPSKADAYNNWLFGAVQRIMAMGFEFSFTDGKLSGAFLSNGQKIGLTENMEKLMV